MVIVMCIDWKKAKTTFTAMKFSIGYDFCVGI